MGGAIISESGGGIIPLRGTASPKNWGAASPGISTHVPYLPDALSKMRRYDLENLGNKSEGLSLVGLNIPVAGRSAKNLLHCHL
jgi:hypothetical protein